MRNKKGFTLAELVIALLLLAILSVVIVSFSLTIHANIANFENVVETTDDMAFLKEMVVQWVSHFDSEDYLLTTDGENILATRAEAPSEQYALYLQETDATEGNGHELVAEYENWTGTYKTKAATGARFYSTTVGGNTLIKCSIEYDTTAANGKEQFELFSFTVGTRVQGG